MLEPPDDAALTTGPLLPAQESSRARGQLAWERLVSLYAPLVYHWCRQAGLLAAEAANLGQEVFAAACHDFNAHAGSRRGAVWQEWLCDLTRAKLREHGKLPDHDLREMATEHPEDNQATVVDTVRLGRLRAVERIRMDFSDKNWQAFWRIVAEAEDPENVARDLAVPLHEVYLAKVRISRRLREEFAALPPY